MITQCFSLLDSKTGIYGTPFFMPHVGAAVRACMDLGSDLNTTVGRHPADFYLVLLGSFDDQSGQFTNEQTHIGSVVSMLPPKASLPSLFDGPRAHEPVA